MRQEAKKVRMNKGLCPDDFEIIVPKDCRLFGPWHTKAHWRKYLETLTDDGAPPSGYDYDSPVWSCDCKEGWRLTGELAIAHACSVHDRIHQQALAFDRVSAVDVGFGIWEDLQAFGDFLAIRIHVNQKLPPELLRRRGFANFSSPLFVMGDHLHLVKKLALHLNEGGDGSSWVEEKTLLELLDPHPCLNGERFRRCLAVMAEEFRGESESERLQNRQWALRGMKRYPISGVSRWDLSLFCRLPGGQKSTDDLRLCICGVPIDIVNASYLPAVGNGSAMAPTLDCNGQGVFAGPPTGSADLKNDEALLIGRGPINPLVGGVSVGNVFGQAGTLGAVVWDETDGTPCILSNWHVLAGSPRAERGQEIFQPAIFDGGTPSDGVAHLKRWVLGDEGDAAIAELSGARHYATGEILGLWHPLSGYQKPRLNMEIRKWGRTTGFTRGFVDGIHFATNIDYGGGVVRYFRDQFHIAPIFRGDTVSQVGDSGSLVVTSFRPLDLHRGLSKALSWLRGACGTQGPGPLCRDIDQQRDRWRDLSRDRPHSEFCGPLWEELTTFEISTCSDPDPNGQPEPCGCGHPAVEADLDCLRQGLERGLGRLVEEQGKLKYLQRILGHIRAWGEQSYRAVCQCSEPFSKGSKDRLERIRQLINDYLQKLSKDDPLRAAAILLRGQEILVEIGKILEEEVPNLRYRPGPAIDTYCRLLTEGLDLLTKELDAIEYCLSIVDEARSAFQKWLDRLSPENPTRPLPTLKRLCKALETYASEADDPHCQDPLDQIARIESYLADEDPLHGEPRRTGPQQEFYKALKKELEYVGYRPKEEPDDKDWFFYLMWKKVAEQTQLGPIPDFLKEQERKRLDEEARRATRAYFAVGMIFAGDTPGSPLGEFAVASDISSLAERLRFSLRPVFEKRSTFRQLRQLPQPVRRSNGGGIGGVGTLSPGDLRAPDRGTGPTPDPERMIDPPSNSGGGGG